MTGNISEMVGLWLKAHLKHLIAIYVALIAVVLLYNEVELLPDKVLPPILDFVIFITFMGLLIPYPMALLNRIPWFNK